MTLVFAHLILITSYSNLFFTLLHMCFLLLHHTILKFLFILYARYNSLSSYMCLDCIVGTLHLVFSYNTCMVFSFVHLRSFAP